MINFFFPSKYFQPGKRCVVVSGYGRVQRDHLPCGLLPAIEAGRGGWVRATGSALPERVGLKVFLCTRVSMHVYTMAVRREAQSKYNYTQCNALGLGCGLAPSGFNAHCDARAARPRLSPSAPSPHRQNFGSIAFSESNSA